MRYKPKILIVDDEQTGRKLLETLLPPAEFSRDFAETGAECLEKARSFNPDLVLLDVRMPDLDGFEVCRRLRREPGLKEIPVIMITAFDEPEARLRGIEAGADDFITKPFDCQEFQARVRSITRLNRYRGLLAERERLHWVLDQSEDGFLILKENDELIDANPPARLFLGLRREEKLPEGIKFLELAKKEYHLEPGTAWSGWPDDISGDSSLKRYLIRPQTDSSHAFWLEVTALEQITGKMINRIIRLRDVTEAQKSLCRIHSFESSISHKFRNRLIETVSIINTMAGKEINLDRIEFRELFQTVVNNARLLQNELMNILRYLETPALLYSDAGFRFDQLSPLLSQISEGLGIKSPEIAGAEDLATLETAISGLAMESILWELLRNAKKFHPAKLPEVTIILDRPDDRSIRMKIMDDGTNLSPEQLTRVWTPYYQGEPPLAGKTEGLGLGLPTTASYIWHWGGNCRLYNRADRPGVVVELILPIMMGNG